MSLMLMMIERRVEFEKEPLQPGIDVICGPMFSGKSDELIRRIRRAPHAGYKVQAFKPDVDTRREPNTINSEDGASYHATEVGSSEEILDLVHSDTAIVAIDEGQFFDMKLTEVCIRLAKRGKRVIVAGLDKDFKGDSFGPMGQLKIEADYVDTLQAFCARCGRPASRTQRVIIEEIQGAKTIERPADFSDPQILVGARDFYQARCREHHEVPGKPIENSSGK